MSYRGPRENPYRGVGDDGSWAAMGTAVAFIGAVAIAALIIGAIALAKFNQNPPPTQAQLNHPAGKMQMHTNATSSIDIAYDMQMQLTGFYLVFGNNMVIDATPGSFLIPQSHSGTYHFDFSVIATSTVSAKKRSILGGGNDDEDTVDVEEVQNQQSKRLAFDPFRRTLQAWLTIDGVVYKNGGWAQDDSVIYTTTVDRPDKRASLTLSGLIAINPGQEIGILLVSPQDCTFCNGTNFVDIYDARLNLFLEHGFPSAATTILPTALLVMMAFLSLL